MFLPRLWQFLLRGFMIDAMKSALFIGNPLRGWIWVLAVLMSVLIASCSGNGDSTNLPANFKSLSDNDKMEYLMENLPPDSVARYIANASMGKIYNSRIELQPSMMYAYEHYSEDDLVLFQEALNDYEDSLPLHEKVRFSKLSGIDDPDIFSYELGLAYVGYIRENGLDTQGVAEELRKLRTECAADPDFYKRFMKGFKTALEYDRHHDLDDKIYKEFITYPDSIQ